jgi:hypothetical protein
VLYEPEPSDKTPGAPEAAAAATASKSSTSKGSGPAETYADLPAMQNAAYRAVSEGLEALFDDYTVFMKLFSAWTQRNLCMYASAKLAMCVCHNCCLHSSEFSAFLLK